MGSKHLGADFVYSWPNAEIAVMGAENAVSILYKKEIDKLENEEQKSFKAQRIEEYKERYINVSDALESGYIDEIIKPNNTKRILYDSLIALEVSNMTCVAKGIEKHGPAPIPEEGKWVQAKEIKDISGLTHGVGWCAPQQGACKLTLNVKEGVIQEALVETIGCSGMTHSAAMASEILPGKTILEALNTDLVCDAINTAMRELFLQIVYGRTQTAFSEGGLPIGAGLEDLGKGLRSQVGTMYGTLEKGPRYLELAEGYVTRIALDAEDRIIGYEFVHLGKMMEMITKKGIPAQEALEKAKGTYGRFADAARYVDPRKE